MSKIIIIDTPEELIPYLGLYGKVGIKHLIESLFGLCYRNYFNSDDADYGISEISIALEYLDSMQSISRIPYDNNTARILSEVVIPRVVTQFIEVFYKQDIMTATKVLQSIDNFKLVILVTD